MAQDTTSSAADSIGKLQGAFQSGGAGSLLAALAEALIEQGDYHRLFDARLVAKKHALGLPLTRPTSFEDVPAEKKDDFEQTYIAAARESAERLLQAGKLSQAWIYYHAIRDHAPLKAVIETFEVPREANERSEEIIDLGLFKGLSPVKGLQVMLATHGTCSTITSLDQQFAQLSAADRAQCAAILVRRLHADLLNSVMDDVRRRQPMAPEAKTLPEAILGREWLFDENNYHIDVSHLNATTRFARALPLNCPELVLAAGLAEYGASLSPQFQYGGDPPFDEFYPASRQFFRALSGHETDAALEYFRGRLTAADDAADQPLIAYVLVDLLVRLGRTAEAVPLAEQYLVDADSEFALPFAELCEQSGSWEILASSAARRGDLVTFVAATLQQN